MRIEYEEQPSPDGLAQALVIAEAFLRGAPSALILGDNLFYGHNFVKIIKNVVARQQGATIFGYEVSDPSAYGVVVFDREGNVIRLEEKPAEAKSNYAIPGIYFYDENASTYAKELKPSARGELEITDLNRLYLNQGNLKVELLGRGTAWLDAGCNDDLLSAANFVQTIEKRQGLKIACPEEIAFRNGWIDSRRVKMTAEAMGKSTYADYLFKVLAI